MESHPYPTHKRNPSLRDNDVASDSVHADLPHIATLIGDGEITLGILDPVGCVAVATDAHNTLAMLKRRPNETLAQLLTRLDQAIERAWTEEIYTDEINPPVSHTFRRTHKRRSQRP